MNERVSTQELCFSLVFVFTIARLARLVSEAHTVRERAGAVLVARVAYSYAHVGMVARIVGISTTRARIDHRAADLATHDRCEKP